MPPKHNTPDPDQPFAIKRSRIQGRGGYAKRNIKKGERLIEYVGERISWAEADRRYDDTTMSRHHTFLFTVNNRTILDAAVGGNDARFLNHSCGPNCEAIDENGRIWIFALTAIRAGEELVYDYGFARDKDTTEEDEKLYVCHCGTPQCRGTILGPATEKPKRRHHVASRQPHEHRGTRRTPGTKGRAGTRGAKRR